MGGRGIKTMFLIKLTVGYLATGISLAGMVETHSKWWVFLFCLGLLFVVLAAEDKSATGE